MRKKEEGEGVTERRALTLHPFPFSPLLFLSSLVNPFRCQSRVLRFSVVISIRREILALGDEAARAGALETVV